MQKIITVRRDKLSRVFNRDRAMSTAGKATRKARPRKPSYKVMIIKAIASQTNSRRGVSRQRIVSFLQQQYFVSTGGRFNAALRSALSSGITSGILKFGDTKQRFKLTTDGRKLGKKKTAKTNGGKANQKHMTRQNTNERADKKTADKSTQCDIVSDQPDYANTGDGLLLHTDADDTNKVEILSELNAFLGTAKTSFVRDGIEQLINRINAESIADDPQPEMLVNPYEQSVPDSAEPSHEISEMTNGNNKIARTSNSDPNDSSSDIDEQCEVEIGESAAHSDLREHIYSAESPWELCNFAPLVFDLIKLNHLRSLLLAGINEMNDEEALILHHNELPIDKVLSGDVIQHILSFGHCNQNRTVCQQWNRLNQQNEAKMLRAMYNAVDDRNLPPLRSGGSIWVVHPKRPTLHPIEIWRGYYGPLKYPDPLRILWGKHVRYLLHPGEYKLPKGAGPCSKTQCIGLSLIDMPKCYIRISSLSPPDKYHVENVIVNWCPNVPGIPKGIELLFKQCTIQMTEYFESMYVRNGGILDVTDCIIQPESNEFEGFLGGIRISSGAKRVNIKDTLFIKCQHCVRIEDRHKNRGAGGPPFPVKVVISNNRFRNTSDEHLVLMVGEYHQFILQLGREDERTKRLREQCTIHGNTSISKTHQNFGSPVFWWTPVEYDPNALYIKNNRGLASRNLFGTH